MGGRGFGAVFDRGNLCSAAEQFSTIKNGLAALKAASLACVASQVVAGSGYVGFRFEWFGGPRLICRLVVGMVVSLVSRGCENAVATLPPLGARGATHGRGKDPTARLRQATTPGGGGTRCATLQIKDQKK